MRKQEIDIEDPSTIKYKEILEYVEASAKSEKAIQRMNAEKSPTSDQRIGFKELLARYQTATAIPKEKKLAEPVVTTSPAPASSLVVDKRIDQLIQAFDRLTINIGTVAQPNQTS